MLLEIKTFTDALRATGGFTTLRARGQSKRARKHVGTLRSGLTACEPSSHVLHAQTLEARGEAKTGCKAWLRQRLHAAIVRMHLEARDAEDGL